ncbi:MAG: circularly permuted type 2 ATP-grasp protein [Pseudomonas sp.]
MIRTYYDEMYDEVGQVRPHYREFARWLAETPTELLAQRRREADLLFHRAGITFTLYGDEQGTERLIPFDTIPRSIPASEWRVVERGCIQRVKALNLFLADLYHDQRIIKAGIIPAEQVLANEQYQLAMQGLDLHRGLYSHVSGVDLVRDGDGTYYVLEDNLRTPSGVSYMLEDRKMMMRLFPELFAAQRIAPIDHYPNLLLDTLKSSSPLDNPSVVVLTPGRFNSAFFEHAFLAREMGVELVEGADLFVRDDRVFMRTTDGPKAVDVIYRRLDDAYLDPLAFNPESMLGVPGLLAAYRSGNVVLANAIGTGVADDKSVYPFVTDMIRFYLDEEPILKNVPTFQCRKPDEEPILKNVPTWQCRKPEELSHVLAHLPELVVKETQGSGGYGMLVGPAATAAEIEAFRARIKAKPHAYIAQPTLCLSTCPTFVENGIAPRHIDLRPFVLSGKETRVVPGGLTRVALREGSLVVNSSQGGGTKDTWVVED